MAEYAPHDWYWTIGEDDSRAWSSAVGRYVGAWPSDRVTHIGTETELNDVLAQYGLRGPLMTAQYVKNEAQRRIIALVGVASLDACIIKQLNALMRATELTGKKALGGLTQAEEAEAAALQALADRIKAIRAASNVLEAMSPIPADYTADAWWQ